MSESKVSPVLQFILLMVPVVMNGFFLVYSLVGLGIEGRDKLNWSLEAPQVAFMVGCAISVFSLLVLGYARWKGLARYHLLNISGLGHLILAVLLTAIVFVIVKL